MLVFSQFEREPVLDLPFECPAFDIKWAAGGNGPCIQLVVYGEVDEIVEEDPLLTDRYFFHRLRHVDVSQRSRHPNYICSSENVLR